jgi:crotonobetaine/carnitine-CoA ligase
MEFRIVDEHDVEVDAGRVGEGVVRSHEPWLLTPGYLGYPEASLALWRNGWLHTGDAFYRDTDGFYHYVDRIRDSIRRRGENVSSLEVETAVNSHPDIVESAAIGVASTHTEDDIKVVAIRSTGSALSGQDLVKYLRTELPAFMVPRYVEFVDALPRTPTAKVRKNVLREAGADGAWDSEKELQK